MKDVTVELKDALTRAQVLTTRLDGHVDGISGSLTTTAPKGKCIYNEKLILCLF